MDAESEYEKYRIIQDKLFESDFDRMLALEETMKEILPAEKKKANKSEEE